MLLTVLLIIVHVVVSLVLILVVLLQTGKRADLAGAFGGGGSQTAFGPRGAATVLSKATTISAIVFMVTSLALAYRMGIPADESVVGGSTPAEQAPAVPAGPGPAPMPAPVGDEPDPFAPAEPPATTPPADGGGAAGPEGGTTGTDAGGTGTEDGGAP